MLQYQHEPISASSQIRILALQPPNADDPEYLFGELETFELKRQPVYEALSYCWGAQEMPESLQLPRGHLSITANLAAGLRQLRLTNQIRRIWVDAICINQNDNAEKSHQVPLMTAIYRNASCVLVWLGAGDSLLYEAIDFMKLAAKSAWKYGISSEFLNPTIYSNTLKKNGNGVRKALQELELQTNASTLLAFFDQSWFRRLWIIQEFVLASKFIVYNGNYTISGDELTVAIKVIWHLTDISGPYQRYLQTYTRAMKMFQTREYIQFPPENDTPQRLHQLVEENCSRERRNDLDILYGIMGLMFEPSDIELPVDYEIPVKDLFVTFVRKYLEKGILAVLPRGEVAEEFHMFRPGLPSWVPDYRVLQRTTTIDNDVFFAATALNTSLILNMEDSRTIGIRGTILDTVNMVSQCPFEYGELIMVEEFRSYINEMRLLYNKLLSGFGTADKSDMIFARLLVSDCRRKRQRVVLKSSEPEYLLNRLLDFEEYYSGEECQLPNSIAQALKEYGSHESRALEYLHAVRVNLITKAIIFTEAGHIGLGARFTKAGDIIVVFDGAEMASVLRKVEIPTSADGASTQDNIQQKWRLIGESYVQGFMDNEVLDSRNDDKRQTFLLV